jgi:hypothetical protein
MSTQTVRNRSIHPFPLAFVAGLALALFLPNHCLADDVYLQQVKPLLQKRCYSCHGALKQKAHLRLDTAALILQGGRSGSAIDRNEIAKSLILERVADTDPESRMPPEHEGELFTAAEIKLLKDWIKGGAVGPADEKPEADPKDHWAFRGRTRPDVPVVRNAGWVKNPIDAFLAKQYEQRGLTPQPQAPREILIRRLYLDLVGMPPTMDEIRAIHSDRDPDWYDKLVDRLLADRRYGERWGRHWMDIWRYSDWWGLGDQLRNSQKHIWHWRDWIVESLNADVSYDEMIRQMLAADELYPTDQSKLRATGFLARNWFLFNRNPWMEEVVEHTSKAFFGLTVNCAKCHDHKFDPISQAEYYRLRAVFEPYMVRLDIMPGEPDLERNGLPRAFDGLLNVPTYRYIRGEESKPDRSTIMAPGVPAFLHFKSLTIKPVTLPKEAWLPERRSFVIDNHIATARDRVRHAERALATASIKLLAARIRPLPSYFQQTDLNAQVEWNVAKLAWESAQSELYSVERRAEALRAEWARLDRSEVGPVPQNETERQRIQAAIVAERASAIALAKRSLAETELRWLRTSKDKKTGIEKELKTKQDELKKAIAIGNTKPMPGDTFSGFVGARWTPTRFLNSSADDPTVAFPSTSTGRRSALANWITDPRNPLTARVAVNHIWMRHFGTPLVPTVFDFGRKGTPPAHPELLDWLASELVDRKWSMMQLHRIMVTSAAYRMTSSQAGGEVNQKIDPDNISLWRRVPIRLESQVIRDSVLSLSGELDLTQGGPPVPADQQAVSKRRSMYFFHSNNERNQFLTSFDEALVKECYRRDQSILPQQALALTNSALIHDASRRIAKQLSNGTDDAAFVRDAFQLILSINASEAEVKASLKAMDRWRKLNPKAKDDTTDPARAYVIWALFNHNDFVTLR